MPIILKICENLQLIAGERMRTARKNAERLVWIVLKWLLFKASNLLGRIRPKCDSFRSRVARALTGRSFSLSFDDISFFVCESDCAAIRENKRNRACIWDSWRALSVISMATYGWQWEAACSAAKLFMETNKHTESITLEVLSMPLILADFIP